MYVDDIAFEPNHIRKKIKHRRWVEFIAHLRKFLKVFEFKFK